MNLSSGRTRLLLACGSFMVLWVVVCQADVVKLKNGRELQGIVVTEVDDEVRVRTRGGEFTLSRRDIDSIDYVSAAENELLRASFLLWQDKLLPALEAFHQASQSGLPVTRIQELVVEGRFSFLSLFSSLPVEERQQALDYLKTFLGEEENEPEFLFLGVQLFAQEGARELAFQWMIRLSPGYWQEHPERRQLAVELVRGHVRALMAAHEYQEAMSCLEEINSFSEGQNSSAQLLLYLSCAAQFREQEKFDQALQIYTDKIMPSYPEVAGNRIVYTFQQLNEWARATSNYPQAHSLWQNYRSKVDLPGLRATYQAFLTDYFDVLLRKGEIHKARQTMEAINELTDNQVQSKQLVDLLRYYELREELQVPGVYKNYQLAKFCLERGLFPQARRELELAKQEPALQENVALMLQTLTQQEQLAELERISSLLDTEQYEEAMSAAYDYVQQHGDSPYRKEAEELIRLSQQLLFQQRSTRPYLAEAYYQQAERAYFLSNFPRAVVKLNLVLTQYPDTPAAERARQLARTILTLVELRRIEVPGAKTFLLPEEFTYDLKEENRDDLAKELELLLTLLRQ